MIPHQPAPMIPADLRLTESELRSWVSKVRELPVVRVDRIVATRDRLRRHVYDRPEILEHTIERVGNEVGVMCRSEDSNEYDD